MFLCQLLFLLSIAGISIASTSTGKSDVLRTTPSPDRESGLDIRHLHILFRHGDRSPIKDRIADAQSSKKLWPNGYGQLTDVGVHQEFDLGRWVRRKYASFIALEYNASEYHMRSTDIDRTLMSAQSFSAGVYLNASSPLVDFGIHWRPIPVHTVPQTEDILLSTAECPCLTLLQQAEMNSEESRKFEQQHAKVFELLTNKTSVHVNRHNVWEFYDTLTCMRAHKFPMPDWYSEELYKELAEIERFYWRRKFASTPSIVRLEIGVFLSMLKDHLLSIVTSSTALLQRRFHLSVQHLMAYSAHDTDVSYLLAAFGTLDRDLIPYSAAIALELLGPKPPAFRSDYRLRLVYKKGYSDQEGGYLQFGACAGQPAEDGCPLQQVLDDIAPLILDPAQFYSECELEAPSSTVYSLLFGQSPTPYTCAAHSKPTGFVVYTVAACIAVILIGIVSLSVGMCLRRRRRSHHRFEDTRDLLRAAPSPTISSKV